METWLLFLCGDDDVVMDPELMEVIMKTRDTQNGVDIGALLCKCGHEKDWHDRMGCLYKDKLEFCECLRFVVDRVLNFGKVL